VFKLDRKERKRNSNSIFIKLTNKQKVKKKIEKKNEFFFEKMAYALSFLQQISI